MRFSSLTILIFLCSARALHGAQITGEEIRHLARNSPEPTAVLFHDEGADVSWWEGMDTEATLFTYPIPKLTGILDTKMHDIKQVPAIKLYKGRVTNTFEPRNTADVLPWINLHLHNVSMLTKKFLPFFANGNSAVVIAQTEETCEVFKQNELNPHVAYACYFEETLVPGCDVALFGKYMDAACVKNASNIYPDLQRNVFPMLMNSDMMNDPLLFQLHPFNKTVFVVSDTPPHVSNVSHDVHVIWERTSSHMFGIYTPTVIRQDLWLWYGHELKTGEAIHNAVYDVLKTTTPLDMARMFMAMSSRNFSLYFDPEWNALKALIPKRPPLPKFNFNFTKPKLTPLPNLTLDLEADKEMARRMGIDIDKRGKPKTKKTVADAQNNKKADAQNNKTEL